MADYTIVRLVEGILKCGWKMVPSSISGIDLPSNHVANDTSIAGQPRKPQLLHILHMALPPHLYLLPYLANILIPIKKKLCTSCLPVTFTGSCCHLLLP